MVSRVLLRKLFRDMLGRAGALLALLVIVTIGVGIFVGMAAVYRDLYDARRRYYAEHHLADFTVDLKRAPAHVVEEVAAMPNVRAARGRVNIGARIDLDDVDEPITGTAISMPEQQLPVLNGILLRSGTWFADGHDKQVILDDAFARATATRCCSPPLSCEGKWAARSARPTRSRAAIASIGSATTSVATCTFSSAVRVGTRL